MKRIHFLIAIIAVSAFFMSCKNSGSAGLCIPKDAAMVVDINTSSLTSKLSWKEITATNWFKDLHEKQDDSLAKKLMENPEASGLDLKSDFAIFVKKQGNGGYAVFQGKINNASEFETMVKKMHDSISIIKTDGDFKYTEGGHNSVLIWNSSRFFALSDAPIFSQMNPFGRKKYDENENVSFTSDSLRKFGKELFSLSSSNSIEKNDHFSALMKESGDVHFYVNTEQFTSAMGGGMLSMLKMNSLFQGNIATFTLNFDNGKIAVKSKQYFGDEMKKVLDKFKMRTVDAALVNRIPSQNVVGAMAVNFDPATANEMLKMTGLDGMANGFLGDFNLNAQETLNAMKGEFLVSVSDLEMKKQEETIPGFNGGQPYTFSHTKTDMKVLFACSVNNRATFEKILNIATKNLHVDSSMASFKLTNEWFVAGNSPEYNDKFLAGGNNHIPFADKISGHPFGLYVDLQKLIKSRNTELKNASDSASYDATIKMWQDVLATGGDYSNGTMTSEFTINLVDQSTNSLKQINQYGEKMYAAEKLRPKHVYMNMNDSTIEPPPVVEVKPQ